MRFAEVVMQARADLADASLWSSSACAQENIRIVKRGLVRSWTGGTWFAVVVLALFLEPHFGSAAGLVEQSTPASDCGTIGEHTPAPSASPVPSSNLPLIDALMEHEANAIQMASVALQGAQDSQVLRMALRVVESHAGELQLLKTWRAKWYPDATPFSIVANESTQDEDTCSMDDFDVNFLTIMIAQRQSAIALAQETIERAKHAELQDFAEAVSRNWEEEIISMQTILERLESGSETTLPASG